MDQLISANEQLSARDAEHLAEIQRLSALNGDRAAETEHRNASTPAEHSDTTGCVSSRAATVPNNPLLEVPADLIPAGVCYTDFFQFLDAHLHPRAYFEIGTHTGNSVRAFTCSAVCVDPEFRLEGDALAGLHQAHLYQMTSDEFFAQHDLRSIFRSGPDICFLDGLHLSEYVLRDFTNTERLCHRRSIIFIHDCLPVNIRMALRNPEPGQPSEGEWRHAWTGDVWKIVPLLKKYRPDLKIVILDCAPTGLLAVTNLDPASTTLTDAYGRLVDELHKLDLSTYSIRRLWDELPVISSRWLTEHPGYLPVPFSAEQN